MMHIKASLFPCQFSFHILALLSQFNSVRFDIFYVSTPYVSKCVGYGKNHSTQTVVSDSFNTYASNDTAVYRRQATAEIISVGLRRNS